jgi:hypothetical protein
MNGTAKPTALPAGLYVSLDGCTSWCLQACHQGPWRAETVGYMRTVKMQHRQTNPRKGTSKQQEALELDVLMSVVQHHLCLMKLVHNQQIVGAGQLLSSHSSLAS